MNSHPTTQAENIHSSPYLYGDLLRVCGAIGVMVTHVAAQGAFRFGSIDPDVWWIYNIIESAFRWAMPIFIILSGALLLDPAKTESLEIFYKKRIARIGIPLLFWSVLYIIWSGNPLESLVAAIAFGLPYYHLDFMFILSGLYLFVPVFRVITRYMDRNHLRGFILLVFILICGATFFRKLQADGLYIFSLPIPYIGYFFLGYYLKNINLNTLETQICKLLLALAIAATAIGTSLTFNSWGPSGFGIYFYDYLSPTAVVMTTCVFILIATASANPKYYKIFSAQIFKWLSKYTLGIYLIHPLILDMMKEYGIDADKLSVWLYFPLTLLILSMTSLLITYIISKIPYARLVVG